MTVHRLLVSAVVAAIAGAAAAVSVAPPAERAPGSAAVPGVSVPATGVTPRWVAAPAAPGCERSTDRYACHRVTVEGTGVDCDPTGCVLEDGGTGWSEQMELQAVAGMYATDPPGAPGG